jgi:hypothetical protein
MADETVEQAVRFLRHLPGQSADERARLFLRDKGLSDAQIELALSLAADSTRAQHRAAPLGDPVATLVTGLAAGSSLLTAARRRTGLVRLVRALLVAFVAGFGAFALCRLALARWPRWLRTLQLARAGGRRAVEAKAATSATSAACSDVNCSQPGATRDDKAASAPSEVSEHARGEHVARSLAELDLELDSLESGEREREAAATMVPRSPPSALGDPVGGGACALRALLVYVRNALGCLGVGAARISTHSLHFAQVHSEPLDRLLHALGTAPRGAARRAAPRLLVGALAADRPALRPRPPRSSAARRLPGRRGRRQPRLCACGRARSAHAPSGRAGAARSAAFRSRVERQTSRIVIAPLVCRQIIRLFRVRTPNSDG